jgi:hypothetical protein
VVLRLRAWAIAALVAAAVTPAVAHGAVKRIKTAAPVATGVVQPGKDDGFGPRCPKSAPHAVGTQAWARTAGALALDQASPFARGRGWDVGVRGMSDQAQTYSIGPICVRAPGRFAYPSRSEVLDPGESSNWFITCPRRAPTAVGGTLEPHGAADVGQVVMSESVQVATRRTPRRWDVGVRNLDSVPHSFWVGAVCMSAKARYVSQFSETLTLQPQQTDGRTLVCPKRAPHPIGGTFFDPDNGGEGQFTLDEVALVGRREITTGVTNRSATPQRLVVGDICIGDR